MRGIIKKKYQISPSRCCSCNMIFIAVNIISTDQSLCCHSFVTHVGVVLNVSPAPFIPMKAAQGHFKSQTARLPRYKYIFKYTWKYQLLSTGSPEWAKNNLILWLFKSFRILLGRMVSVMVVKTCNFEHVVTPKHFSDCFTRKNIFKSCRSSWGFVRNSKKKHTSGASCFGVMGLIQWQSCDNINNDALGTTPTRWHQVVTK